MNGNDINTLERLNERYTPVNLTAFRLVNKGIAKKTVLDHIRTDLEILNTCDVDYKYVCRVIARNDCIDICVRDNGTPICYFFTGDAAFTPKDISSDVKKLCDDAKVGFEEIN